MSPELGKPANFSPIEWSTAIPSVWRSGSQLWEWLHFWVWISLNCKMSCGDFPHLIHFFHSLITLYIKLPLIISLCGLCLLILFRLIQNLYNEWFQKINPWRQDSGVTFALEFEHNACSLTMRNRMLVTYGLWWNHNYHLWRTVMK